MYLAIFSIYILENGEWDLRSATQLVSSKHYSDQDLYFSVLDVKLQFVRRSLFYNFNFVLPVSLITILSISGFILPSESGEKIGLRKSLMFFFDSP